MEGCIEGACFLLELKVVHYQRKTDGFFKLEHYTRTQAWTLYKRWKNGGRSWLLVRVPGSEKTGRHYLVAGREALIVFDARMKLTTSFLEAVSWPGFEEGTARASELWVGIAGPIK